MPLNLIGYVTSVREARELLVLRLRQNQEVLNLGYIGKDDEKRLPGYPAVVVSAGDKRREYHGTHTYNISLSCLVWVYHAKLSVGHAVRSDEDLMLTEEIEYILCADQDYGGAFISSYVEDVQPGVIQPAASKSEVVIGSRLLWTALSQERFR
jgi:hypothetical protein